LVVAFSLERLIAVYFPLKLTTICSKNKTHAILIGLILFALAFYSFSFFTSGIELNGTEKSCVTLAFWFPYMKMIVLGDVLLTTIFPFVIITVINVLIAYKLKKMQKFVVTPSKRPNFDKRVNLNRFLFKHHNNKRRRIRTYSEVTKTLLVISFVFLTLNFPLALNKLWYCVNENILQTFFKTFPEIHSNLSSDSINSTADFQIQLESSEYEEIFERITCYIFYLNFSFNFFLYTFNKSKFRELIVKNFRNRFFEKNSDHSKTVNNKIVITHKKDFKLKRFS